MNNNSETVIKELLKWLARNGGKYPRPGLRPNLGEITYALKDALVAMRDSIPTDALESIVHLAEIGASTITSKPHSIPAIRLAAKTIKRARKCQDTESQPQTPQG